MKQQRANVLVKVLMDDQQDDGSFVSYSVPKGSRTWAGTIAYKTTFAPALIAGALSGIQDPQLEQVRQRATKWLLAQRSRQWSFNYWAREAAEAKSRPYPDDWDDTSCAVIAISLSRPDMVTGEALGHLVTLLTNTEMAEGGPYRTWVVPSDAPEHWQDVDVAVNSNIAYMLRLHGVDLPNLEQFTDQCIVEDHLGSPYYPTTYPIEYFVSRWYQGPHRERLRERIAAREKDGHWGNPLDTALAVSALLNLGVEPKVVAKAVAWLRGLDGAKIEAQGFCLDPAIEGRAYVAGSRALTAAFCLEALAKYDGAVRERSSGKSAAGGATQKEDAPAGRIHDQVVAGVALRTGQMGAEIEAAGQQLRSRLLEGTAASQITLLPYLFRQALGRQGRGISDERLVGLGTISLYGWIAYTVYDDFLDEEGEPPLLPLANVAMRELVLALQEEAGRTAGFGDVAWPVLDRQEAANAWEVTHCRVPRQGDLLGVKAPEFGDRHVLAERSMGHALGCLALTMELGHGTQSEQVRAVRAFFYHFLIARQLSDDAHDWKADLQKGQINAVGAYLLSGVERRGKTVRGLYGQLERYFWEYGITQVNEWTLAELAQARAALKQALVIERPAVLEALLVPIEEAARQAEVQQRQTAEFLRAYRPDKAA